jgi:hypothetical protein
MASQTTALQAFERSPLKGAFSRASMHQCFQGAEENAQIVLSLVEGRDILIDVEQRVDRDLSRADRIFDCLLYVKTDCVPSIGVVCCEVDV